MNDSSESNDSCVTSSTGLPPPPLAPLSGANIRKPTIKVDTDDSNSTGNNSIASFKDNCSATGRFCTVCSLLSNIVDKITKSF